MFYLLLILPHVLAIGGLLAFALHSAAGGAGGEQDEGWDGGGGSRTPPNEPPSPSPRGGLPLCDADPPRRRLRAGERLSELHPRLPRREHERRPPHRTPAGR